MRTNADKTEIRIEKEGFAPVVIKSKPDTQYPVFINENNNDELRYPMDRAFDGMVKETLLPDGTVVQTFKEKHQAVDQMLVRHMIIRPDFSVIVVNSDGRVSVISSNTRSALNECGGKAKIGNDTDYLKELKRHADKMIPCIYYAQILPVESESRIYTSDKNMRFRIDLTVDQKMSRTRLQGGEQMDSI